MQIYKFSIFFSQYEQIIVILLLIAPFMERLSNDFVKEISRTKNISFSEHFDRHEWVFRYALEDFETCSYIDNMLLIQSNRNGMASNRFAFGRSSNDRKFPWF